MNKSKVFFWIVIIVIIIFGNVYRYFIRVEQFTNSQITQQANDGTYFQNISMPLNTTYGCKNICGPQNRCSITGEQCSYDRECHGCRPPSKQSRIKEHKIRGQNDAGNATTEENSTYSTLTTDIGTQTSLYNKNAIGMPSPQYFKGVNKWRKAFNVGQELYDKRYSPSSANYEFMPTYPIRPSMSGEFNDIGPLAANDYLSKV
jgi:hypothetical protein